MSDSAPLLVQRQQLHARRAALVSVNARDPRAPAAPHTGSVVVAESCEFYGIADAVSRCRVPRSCQDCLATPGCGISDTGYCLNATSDAGRFTGYLDYRSANFSANSLISTTPHFVFLAGSASYCAASDPVCTKCREQFQADDANKTSKSYAATQFCKGADGCVCIAICEVPRRRAARVIDWQCGQPDINADPLPAISRLSHTTVHTDPRAPAVKMLMPPKDTESCEYTKEVDLRGCRRPRSCESCLDQPACSIVYGRCYSDFSPTSDFRNAELDANNMSIHSSTYYFPSSNTTYCPISDSTCAVCRQKFRESNVDDWNLLLNMHNNFCIGQDGCVCIQACESELRATSVVDTECDRTHSSVKYPNPAGFFAVAAAVWFVLWLVYKCSSRARRPPPQDQRLGNRPQQHNLWRNMLDEVPALPVLDLFGWRAYRLELRNRERELLAGGDVSRAWHPVDFESLGPSAPDFDEDDSSAPTAQDPKALASAPVYRRSFHDRDSISEETGSSIAHDTDHSSPSAPDFDDEEAGWEQQGSERERIGLITRRPWRGE